MASGMLFAFSLAMFAGAFLAGYLPLSISISPARMRMLTVFGAGILIGAALNVIIPEGLHMWAAALEQLEEAQEQGTGHPHGEHEGHHEGHHEHSENWQIGTALSVGFAFMLVVDRLSGDFGHSHTSAPAAPLSEEPTKSEKNQSAMLGLLVHAAVDGVALGATLFAGMSEASWIVFLAIMMHKAPAAFGLTTYLMQATDNTRVVRSQLFLFSIAAPVGAFVTYYGMYAELFGYDPRTLALVMLFSGGTFLYVATAHILPDIMHATGRLTWTETGLNALGTILPMFLNVPHGH